MSFSNQQLKDAFLNREMRCYFEKKVPELGQAELDIRIEEALKFLNIASYCKGDIPVSREIDDIWHLWILETREYEQLCKALQGREFIHHSSNAYLNCGSDEVQTVEAEIEEQVALLGAYVANYGPFEADRIRYWTLAAHLVEQMGWSVEQLNEWLTTGLQRGSAAGTDMNPADPSAFDIVDAKM